MRLKPSHRSSPRYRPYANSQRVSPSLSEARAEPRLHSRQEFATRELYHANVLVPPAPAKLPDYIGAVLRCKGVSRLLNSTCVHLLGWIPALPTGIASIATVTAIPKNGMARLSSVRIAPSSFHGHDTIASDAMSSSVS